MELQTPEHPPPSKPAKRSKAAAVLVLWCGVVTVALLELALRIADPLGARYFQELGIYFSPMPLDTIVGYRHVPNERLTFRKWSLNTNKDGLRGPDLPAHKDPGIFRLLLLGDSVAMGLGGSLGTKRGRGLGSNAVEGTGSSGRSCLPAQNTGTVITLMRLRNEKDAYWAAPIPLEWLPPSPWLPASIVSGAWIPSILPAATNGQARIRAIDVPDTLLELTPLTMIR